MEVNSDSFTSSLKSIATLGSDAMDSFKKGERLRKKKEKEKEREREREEKKEERMGEEERKQNKRLKE